MGALPGGPFGPLPHYHADPTEALVNAQLSSSQTKASSSSQGPLPMIAPKPPSLDFGSTAPFHYLGVYPHLHRASSSTGFGLGIHQPQYIVGQMSPDQLFAQPSMSITSSPTQMRQPDWFDFRMHSHSPSQSSSAILTTPVRRHTVYTRIENERPLVSPILQFEPSIPPPQPVSLDTREPNPKSWFPSETKTLAAEQEGEEDMSSSINNPGLMVANRLQSPVDLYGTQIRSFHSLAGENILTNYSPSPADTPLNDPQTASVFWYFVNVTAPALSLFERNPLDPSRMFSGEPIPKSHQHIWTSTLAATLLLGFYEVWSSNHEKWCTHMIGARQLIKETPFSEMSRQILAIHQQRRQQWMEKQVQDPFSEILPQLNNVNHELAEVDLGLVSRLSGKPVRFIDSLASPTRESGPRRCTERDIENFEHMMDLYWWFCKMDVYQSTLGASKLLYGTYDHLILLLGRLVTFVSNDLPRKRKARDRESSSSPRGPNSPPMFPGMFPGRGNIKFPRGLSPPQEPFPSAENIFDAIDLETSTHKALEEWNSILQAFELFKSCLGPDFNPLGEEVHPPQDSPFGPALTYRTYSIAGIWMNFYMGLVLLHRAHPSMPPFAMLAAHMVVEQTDPYANEIGRLVAGVAEEWTLESMVSTVQSAAYIECCFPLFVAAVQFRDKLQRQWTIRRLHDITRLTGWQTGDQIANGCEGAWRKASAMGFAPPYEPESESDALRQGWTTRRLDERIQEVDEGQNKPVLQRSDRAHVAFGLLSVEDDMERLTLED
ncbi:hypothetical protein SLS53_007718 [Cytospora paraplurivora]|uniref:Transcription factor domain-containing protein n=1 Tax=Cytospora paraplurivora TaxID=2898453 RepID=A0AAN9U0L5_9PEZI